MHKISRNLGGCATCAIWAQFGWILARFAQFGWIIAQFAPAGGPARGIGIYYNRCYSGLGAKDHHLLPNLPIIVWRHEAALEVISQQLVLLLTKHDL